MKTLAVIAFVAWTAATGTTLHIAATPCQTEDSTLCYWDGTARGNKTGDSFIALTDTLSIVWDNDKAGE